MGDFTDSSVDQGEQKTNLRFVFVVILAIFILGAGAVYKTVKDSSPAKSPDQSGKESQQQVTFKPTGRYTLVYGQWSGSSSVIKVLDVGSGQNGELAELPSAIKKVGLLPDNKLVYIDQTDDQDHGKQVSTYDLSNKKTMPVATAADGFGIDDYVLSPNKRYLAVWEVAFAPNSGLLTGGKSRVYSIDLQNPSTTNLIYDEVQQGSTPVHYPRAITNSGQVYADTFLPNNGAGWAYGMSVSDFTGQQKQDLAQMKNGTYSSQPQMSFDGRYLLFTGYDGSKGPGTTVVNGFRQALLTPNTVEVLDTQNNTRRALPLPKTYSYLSAMWDQTTGNIVFTAAGKDKTKTGTYIYDLRTQKPRRIYLDGSSNTQTVVSTLPDGKLLAGTLDASVSTLGNLGDTYSAPFTKFSIVGDHHISIARATAKYDNCSIQQNGVTYDCNGNKIGGNCTIQINGQATDCSGGAMPGGTIPGGTSPGDLPIPSDISGGLPSDPSGGDPGSIPGLPGGTTGGGGQVNCQIQINGQSMDCSGLIGGGLSGGLPSDLPGGLPGDMFPGGGGSTEDGPDFGYGCDLDINGLGVGCDSEPMPEDMPFEEDSFGGYLGMHADVNNLDGKKDVKRDVKPCKLIVNGKTFDCRQPEMQPVSFSDNLMQYITLAPSSYFKINGKDATLDQGNCNGKENLQLCTLAFKPQLAPKREEQQANPVPNTPRVETPGIPNTTSTETKCRDLAAAQCGASSVEAAVDSACFANAFIQAKRSGQCYDSPLYLYGNPGQQVSVTVNTPLYDSNLPYNNGYNVTLLPGGKLSSNGKTYASIEYNYNPAIKRITPPTYGTVATKSEVGDILTSYAHKLGLNDKETQDLVAYGKSVVVSPYVFVSFFDQHTSERILPLSFSPAPDNYRNIVFYFRLLNKKPSATPVPPTFPGAFPRSGFTAVEISGIVE